MAIPKAKDVKLGTSVGIRSIRFNQVCLGCKDFGFLDKEYSLFRIHSTNHTERNRISAVLRKQDWVIAVRNTPYEDSADRTMITSVYAMCENSGDEGRKIAELVENLGSASIGKPVTEQFATTSAEVVLQLLANSLEHKNVERINNVLGRCLTVHKFNNYSDAELKKIHREIVCLEFLFRKLPSIETPGTEDIYLTNGVVTFTNLRDAKYIRFRKGKSPESYPHLVNDLFGLRMADSVEDKGKEQYIERVTGGHSKNLMKFFNSGSEQALDSTKSAYIDRFLKNLNDFYPDLKIGLKRIDSQVFEPTGNSSNIYHMEKARELVEKCSFRFVNLCEDDVDDIFDEVKKRFALKKRPSLDSFSEKPREIEFVLIHSHEYYEDQNAEDAYQKESSAECVQHVTVEKILDFIREAKSEKDLDTAWKLFAENCIENMAVKLENAEHKFLLTKWPQKDADCKEIDTKLTFCMRARDAEEDEDEPRFVSYTVNHEGTFSEPRLLDEENDDDYALIEAMMVDPVKIEVAIRNGSGNTNLIWSTDAITVPRADAMRERLEYNRDNNLRQEGLAGRDAREELYPECVDIGYRILDDRNMYYYVGKVGPGVTKSFNNAVNVRRVTAYRGSALFFPRLIPMLSVPYVRHNQSTVHPFPCKNLFEWLDLHYHSCGEEED